jgi:predicted alpha/beta hydrolase family esterase
VISRKQTVTATTAMVGHSVGCQVIARNAGGRFDDFSPKIGRLVIR